MAGVSSGPISGLPGKRHQVPNGKMCDEHNDRPAVYRIQGETDSFGCEFLDMCQECYDGFCAAGDQMLQEYCDLCKTKQDNLKHYRDPEEGTSGPVYIACPACIIKNNDSFTNGE